MTMPDQSTSNSGPDLIEDADEAYGELRIGPGTALHDSKAVAVETSTSRRDLDMSTRAITSDKLLAHGKSQGSQTKNDNTRSGRPNRKAATEKLNPQHTSKEHKETVKTPRQGRNQSEKPITPTTPASVSTRIYQAAKGMLSPGPVSVSINSECQVEIAGLKDEIQRLEEVLNQKDRTINHLKKAPRPKEFTSENCGEGFRNSEQLQLELQQVLEREYHFRQQHEQTVFNLSSIISAKDQENMSLTNKIEDSAKVIRDQQERSFRQMETGRWLPSEESRVKGDLGRISRDMKAWSKAIALKDMSWIQGLIESDRLALMNTLACVVVLNNNELPRGLLTPKSSMILLNALLSHDIYTSIIMDPFAFLREGLGVDLPEVKLGNALNQIYRSLQASNPEDAHLWRSQMLRSFLPPPRLGNHEGEDQQRAWTEGAIKDSSLRQANSFADGPAHHFINKESNADYKNNLVSIYQDAAMVAYQLWTRKTTMKCTTLNDMGHPLFDVDDPRLVAHSLVHPEEHDDQLKNRPISVIVRPLLQVYGTDDGKDYNQGRVWAPAEVWLDCKS